MSTYREILLSLTLRGSYTFKTRDEATSAMSRANKLYGSTRKFSMSGATITRIA